MEDNGGAAVAEAATARLKEMKLWGNLAQVARLSDVSDATWRKLLRKESPEPPTRPDKRAQICNFLGWDADAIDRILAGGRPRPNSEAVRQAQATLEERLREIEAEVQRLRLDLGLQEEAQESARGRPSQKNRRATGSA